MKKSVLLPGLVFFMLACNSEGDKKEELAELKKQEAEIKTKIAVLEAEIGTADTSKTNISVFVMPVKASIFKNYIDVQGRVDADENVTISSEMPGTITKIHVKVGDEVSKGQVLAETDSRALAQSLSDLQTNADLVDQIYQKQKNLWDQKIGTEIQYLQAKANKESMEKKLGALQEQIRMGKIISPINGTVDAVDVKLGQMVSPGMPSMRVINFSNLKVKSDVAESYASKIRKGNEVIVYFPDMQDSVITKVNFVSRAINNASRTFTVEVLLDNKKEYHPNMVAQLKINDYQSATPAITVPVRTIQKDEEGKSFVFVAENGTAKKCIIETGKQYSGQTEIISGLKENDLLITLGYDQINEGDKIAYSNNLQ